MTWRHATSLAAEQFDVSDTADASVTWRHATTLAAELMLIQHQFSQIPLSLLSVYMANMTTITGTHRSRDATASWRDNHLTTPTIMLTSWSLKCDVMSELAPKSSIMVRFRQFKQLNLLKLEACSLGIGILAIGRWELSGFGPRPLTYVVAMETDSLGSFSYLSPIFLCNFMPIYP